MAGRTEGNVDVGKSAIARENKAPDRALVLAELKRLTDSPRFAGSARLKRLLHFLVEETLAGRGAELRGAAIGVRFFERGDGFDPATDPIVRVEICKLRGALQRCYPPSGSGGLRIEIPVGSYAPRFVEDPSPPPSRPHSARQAWLPGGPTITIRAFACGHDGVPAALARDLPEQIAALASRVPFLHVLSPSADTAPEGYVLDGSVRVTPDAWQINVSLREPDGQVVWGETHQRTPAPAGAIDLQRELVETLFAQLFDFMGGVLNRTETLKMRREEPRSRTVYGAMLTLRRWFLTLDPADLVEARLAADAVLQVEPNMVTVLALVAISYVIAPWTRAGGEASRAQAAELARRAVAADPLVQASYSAAAFVHMDAGDSVRMRQAAQRAAAVGTNPSLAGFLLAIAGEWERGTALLRRQLDALPGAPGWFHHALFLDAYRRADYPAARLEAQLIGTPNLAWDPLDRAAVLGQLGEVEAAGAALTELLAVVPTFGGDPRGHLRRMVPDQLLVEALLGGLREAGLVVP